MFDTFLSCVVVAIAFNILNAGIQISIMGRDRYVHFNKTWTAGIEGLSGLSCLTVFFLTQVLGILFNSVLLWLWWGFVFAYALSFPISIGWSLKMRD